MKRTTYIMIGMLVTGVAMVCGLMFYVVDRNVTQKDNFMEIGGERKTVQLPSCRVLKLTQPPVVWKQKEEGIVAENMLVGPDGGSETEDNGLDDAASIVAEDDAPKSKSKKIAG